MRVRELGSIGWLGQGDGSRLTRIEVQHLVPDFDLGHFYPVRRSQRERFHKRGSLGMPEFIHVQREVSGSVRKVPKDPHAGKAADRSISVCGLF